MKNRNTWQLLAALFIAILGGASARAQGFRYDSQVLLDTGRIAQGASIRVCAAGSTGTPCTPLASIFSDQGLSLAITQPGFQSDAQGNFNFYAACNRYDIQITGNGITTRTLKDVQVGPCNQTGFFQSGNTVRVAGDFTTAANTSLQAITGLSWSAPAVAASYSFHCVLSYSQATAPAAVAFGIQAATNAPTNIFANGAQQITVGPPATEVNGTLATLGATTATNIVSGTPGATATLYLAMLDGTIENPASLNTFKIMVSTAVAGDAVTVKRGSYCQLF